MAPVSKVMRIQKTALGGNHHPEPRLHLWRTVGPNIPRQVASQQSLTPFLRAASRYQTPLDIGAMLRKSTATRRDDESKLKTNIVATGARDSVEERLG
jgi:hypothetical protein